MRNLAILAALCAPMAAQGPGAVDVPHNTYGDECAVVSQTELRKIQFVGIWQPGGSLAIGGQYDTYWFAYTDGLVAPLELIGFRQFQPWIVIPGGCQVGVEYLVLRFLGPVGWDPYLWHNGTNVQIPNNPALVGVEVLHQGFAVYQGFNPVASPVIGLVIEPAAP